MPSNWPVPACLTDRPYAHQHFTAQLDWAYREHPFYQRWLHNLNGEVPILSRSDILENNTSLLNGHAVTARTSGSTGVPVKIAWSVERSQLDDSDTNQFIQWLGGLLPRTRLIHAPDNTNPEVLDINANISEQINFILKRYQQHKAVAITSYPTNAEQLSSEVLARGIDMGFIQRFGCYSEVFEPQQEAAIKAAFPNASIWSTYSAMEFGLIAARCPHEPSFHHYMAHKLGVEVLDDEDQPCPPGQIGRLVITDYFNRYSPLIRYEIGDLAAYDHCPCGRIGLPALSQIKGKVRGALKHRDGRRVMFTELSVAIRDIEGMQQYQVIQTALNSFTLRFTHNNHTTGGSPNSAFQTAVNAAFKKHFGYLPHITMQAESHIPRDPNGKFYASICQI